jgi:hypothetical protein
MMLIVVVFLSRFERSSVKLRRGLGNIIQFGCHFPMMDGRDRCDLTAELPVPLSIFYRTRESPNGFKWSCNDSWFWRKWTLLPANCFEACKCLHVLGIRRRSASTTHSQKVRPLYADQTFWALFFLTKLLNFNDQLSQQPPTTDQPENFLRPFECRSDSLFRERKWSERLSRFLDRNSVVIWNSCFHIHRIELNWTKVTNLICRDSRDQKSSMRRPW